MKRILMMLIFLTRLYAINETNNQKKCITINNNRKIVYCHNEKIDHLILNLKSNKNANIKINTQYTSYSYNIPTIINQDQTMILEIKINNIKSINFNNIEIQKSSIQTTKTDLQKFKIFIDKDGYSIDFNLNKNMFPIIGFKSKETILNPIITNLYSKKESQKIVLSNLIKYTSLENYNDEIKSIKNDNMIQINEIGYINMNDYYEINKPINADLKLIFNYTKKNYRRDSFEFFNFIANPNVYIIKFKTLHDQALMLKRMAFFLEKKEFRGRLLSNTELENKVGWGGHDYRLQDIITFFNKAQKLNIKLNKEEITLKNLIIANKLAYIVNNIIKIKNKSKNIAFATYSEDEIMSKTDQMRIFMHEMLHMYFFTDNNFNKEIVNFWNKNISPNNKKSWINFLDNIGYDVTFNYLVMNEFYAYTTALPKENIANYLINTNYFSKTEFKEYEQWAIKLEKLLWQTKGLIPGELLILFKDNSN
ncbi:hypothetical protein [Borrelia crocidurae]|nr:hypothetical protein [Borrelia crocidurae]